MYIYIYIYICIYTYTYIHIHIHIYTCVDKEKRLLGLLPFTPPIHTHHAHLIFTLISHTSGADTVRANDARISQRRLLAPGAAPFHTSYSHFPFTPIIHRRFIYKGDTSTHAEGTDPGGVERASEGCEALWPPVLNARRRQKRQHLHRCHTSHHSHPPFTSQAQSQSEQMLRELVYGGSWCCSHSHFLCTPTIHTYHSHLPVSTHHAHLRRWRGHPPGCGRWYASSPRHLRSSLSEGCGSSFGRVWCCSCRVCVCVTCFSLTPQAQTQFEQMMRELVYGGSWCCSSWYKPSGAFPFAQPVATEVLPAGCGGGADTESKVCTSVQVTPVI